MSAKVLEQNEYFEAGAEISCFLRARFSSPLYCKQFVRLVTVEVFSLKVNTLQTVTSLHFT